MNTIHVSNKGFKMIMIEPTNIPTVLIVFRLAVAPLLLMDALDGHITIWFLAGYILAVVSDVFDSIITRRLKVSTVKLRQADSKADICLYLCVAASAWLIYPQVISDFAPTRMAMQHSQYLSCSRITKRSDELNGTIVT